MGQVKNALLEIEGIIVECINDKKTMEETVEYCNDIFHKTNSDNSYLFNKELIRKIYTNFVYQEAINL